MSRVRRLILLGLIATLTAGDGAARFQAAMGAFLAQAPLKVGYHYTVEQGDFKQEQAGTLYLARRGVFRLELWDKVYGSDGQSLYLHDLNTHQTIIDSLRWTDVNLWMRVLNEELPVGTQVTVAKGGEKGLTFHLDYGRQWQGVVAVDTAAHAIREIVVHERDRQFRHHIILEQPQSWDGGDSLGYVTLQDLPGLRLDLR